MAQHTAQAWQAGEIELFYTSDIEKLPYVKNEKRYTKQIFGLFFSVLNV
jgi:hypothetical protein